MMDTKTLRTAFLEFFENKGHKTLPSSSTIPFEDPTLLFTNAGMNQFKEYFLGEKISPHSRITTSQKCVRVGGKHNDLDNVGHTSRHLTFFEMLGNFSFGDYFKEEAIDFAYDLSMKLGIDMDRVYPTVYEKDDESFELWKKYFPEKRITRMGEKDNFWSMGDIGPCGPCTELLFDRGSDVSQAPSPKEDPEGERFFEYWNLVFMQFNRSSGKKDTPLTKPCVDTGMGLERMLMIAQNATTVFETDVLRSIIEQVEKLSGKKYHPKDEYAPAFHVIADHLRSLCFTIADGAQPSNTDRGYVLRKLLRRSIRYGKQLGLHEPFLCKLVGPLTKLMGNHFGELKDSRYRTEEILQSEEENFFRTLNRGEGLFQKILETAKTSSHKEISGEDAFKLKDTYGLPFEEILLLAKDNHLTVHLESYELLEKRAKELSRSAQKLYHKEVQGTFWDDFAKMHDATQFVGYDTTSNEGSLIGILQNGKWLDQLDTTQDAALIFNQTPFYPEMGGQIGDKGVITHENMHFTVTDTKKIHGFIVHFGKLEQGHLILGEPCYLEVDLARRNHIQKNHTATHLLHWALFEVLGSHIMQRGSLVADDRLRFDFSHHKAMTQNEIIHVEKLVNEKIRENFSVSAYETKYESVKGRKDIKQFFGDKYFDTVRVVDIAQFSKELCGGTHVAQLCEIGLFRITKESSIGGGIRRIEAVTSRYAEDFMYEKEYLLENIGAQLGVPEAKILPALESLQHEITTLKEEIKSLKKLHVQTLQQELEHKIQDLGTLKFLGAQVELAKDEMQLLLSEIAQKHDPIVIFFIINKEDSTQLVIKVSSNLQKKGIKAKELIQKLFPLIGGKGGGKDDMAMAGGKKLESYEKAIHILLNALKSC